MKNNMKKFKNPKALALLKEAKEIEEFVAAKEPELERNNMPFSEYDLELLTRAAGLAVLAEDIEEGVISEDELEDT